jgi:casein kinase II subunit beta
VLPVGTSDNVGLMSVKLFCPRCEDVFVPSSKRHQSTDGAYFGTSFPHFMAQVYTDLIAAGGDRKERYVPKIFGFKIHEVSVEQKKQDAVREEQMERLAMIEG